MRGWTKCPVPNLAPAHSWNLRKFHGGNTPPQPNNDSMLSELAQWFLVQMAVRKLGNETARQAVVVPLTDDSCQQRAWTNAGTNCDSYAPLTISNAGALLTHHSPPIPCGHQLNSRLVCIPDTIVADVVFVLDERDLVLQDSLIFLSALRRSQAASSSSFPSCNSGSMGGENPVSESMICRT